MKQSDSAIPHFRPLVSAIAVLALATANTAPAAYLLEIDTDGLDDGVLTYNANFGYGGDTTTASQSAASTAFGLTGGDSIFGGDGVSLPDTYLYTYDPSVHADNLVIPGGTDLGEGVLASGKTGGLPDTYAVFATWPLTDNVSGGLTTFTATTAGDSFVLQFDQTAGGANTGPSTGNIWYKLGEISWTAGPITLAQEAGSNTFVSMRAAGVLFEAIPEPSVLALSSLAGLALVVSRGRSAKR